MTEATILSNIRAALNRRTDVRAFRNNCGTLRDERGTYVRYGIPGPGGSDLLGWVSVTITPEMVGQRFARLLSIEVKADARASRLTDEQANWLAVVAEAGGLSGVARTVADAERIIGMTP